jgi:hypothetical protein
MLENRKLRQRIEAILAEVPHCRDDDNRLIANVWHNELLSQHGEEGYGRLSGHEVLGTFAKHKLSNPESIRRMRQKIQELQPLLRGKTYKARQRHQSQVKKEIRQFNNH